MKSRLVFAFLAAFTFVEDILPTESNPKTGMIVGMAIVKAVRQLSSPLVIGL